MATAGLRNRNSDGAAAAAGFIGGVNSYLAPPAVPQGQLAWGQNIQLRRGEVSTRPGFNTILQGLPDATPKGLGLYESNTSSTMLLAIGTSLYKADYPFTGYELVAEDIFINAETVVFTQATRALDETVTPISPPLPVMMITDGINPLRSWDPANGLQTHNGSGQPEGALWAAWAAGRLWLCTRREIFASNIYDPFSFTENQYLAGGGSFVPADAGIITGIKAAPNGKALYVFTYENVTRIRIDITERSQWQTGVDDFVSLAAAGIGCIAGKSIVAWQNELWWMDAPGVRRLNTAISDNYSNRVQNESNEMDYSRQKWFKGAEKNICGFAFNNFAGWSVPQGVPDNRATWVADSGPVDLLQGSASTAWLGIWTGIQPVEWVAGNVDKNDRRRVYCLSKDRDGQNRVWEAFIPNQLDNCQPITAFVDTRGHTFGPPADFHRFAYGEWHLSRLRGRVALSGYARGDYGCWWSILDTEVCANIDGRDQARYIKTQSVQQLEAAQQSKEGPYTDQVGTYFQMRLLWSGIVSIRMYSINVDQEIESGTGACAAPEAECLLAPCDYDPDYISPPDYNFGYGYGYGYQEDTPLDPECGLELFTATATVETQCPDGTGDWSETATRSSRISPEYALLLAEEAAFEAARRNAPDCPSGTRQRTIPSSLDGGFIPPVLNLTPTGPVDQTIGTGGVYVIDKVTVAPDTNVAVIQVAFSQAFGGQQVSISNARPPGDVLGANAYVVFVNGEAVQAWIENPDLPSDPTKRALFEQAYNPDLTNTPPDFALDVQAGDIVAIVYYRISEAEGTTHQLGTIWTVA